MTIFDIFKRKKKEERVGEKEVKKEVEKKKETPLPKKERAKKEKKEILPSLPAKKKMAGAGYGVLRFPHITEKATNLTEKNKYVFKVWSRANKKQIKRAIENSYGVDVVKVNIVNIKGKERRLGRQEGWKGGYKKAIVKIKEGQKIEILPR